MMRCRQLFGIQPRPIVDIAPAYFDPFPALKVLFAVRCLCGRDAPQRHSVHILHHTIPRVVCGAAEPEQPVRAVP